MAGAQTPFQNYATVAIIDPTSESGGVVNALKPNADGSLPVQVVDQAPASTNILDGALSSAGTLITIPAGRTWIGFVSCGATIVVAPGSATPVTGYANLAVSGTGSSPPNPTSIAFAQGTAPGSATASPGTAVQVFDFAPNVTAIAPVGNSITIVLSASNAASVWAKAVGTLQ